MKQNHKSKEQIVFEKEQQKLAEKRMKFINENFMPEMELLTNSLEEAQMVAETVKIFIEKGAQQKLNEMKVGELGLVSMINNAKKPELLQKHARILKVLEDQTISDAQRLCDGLFDAVNKQLLDELKTRKLSDFKK